MPDRPSTDSNSSSAAFCGRVGASSKMIGIDRSAFTPKRIVLVGRPVEAGHAGHLAAAGAADHDVVAAFADELVEAAVAEEHVVAVDAVMREDLVEVVAGGAVEGAGLDPVVAFVAEDALGVLVAVDEVVAFAGEHFRAHVGAEEDEVLAAAAHDQVEARAGMDDVVAVAGLDVVVAAAVDDDVVAVAAVDDVVAEAAFEPVVAAVAKERVVADAGDQDVVGFGAAEDDVVAAGVAQIVGVRAGGRRVVADDQRRQDAAASGSCRDCRRFVDTDRQGSSAGCRLRRQSHPGRVELLGLVDLEDQAGRREHVRRQMRRVGVAHDHGGEGIVLHLAEQMQAVEALQIVEAVAVLQLLHLHFEDEVEGRAQHAAEGHDLLRPGRRSRDRHC